MSAQPYPIERINQLRERSRFWCKSAIAVFVFDIIWFLWLRPTFFPSPIAFNLVLIQIALISAPVLCLIFAIGISWERIIHSGVKPETLGDKLAIIVLILLALFFTLTSVKILFTALTTGRIPIKSSTVELANSPFLFVVIFVVWLVATGFSVFLVRLGLYFFRHGEIPPNPTLKQ